MRKYKICRNMTENDGMFPHLLPLPQFSGETKQGNSLNTKKKK